MSLFLSNTHLFISQDELINCRLLWCLYQLFGLILMALIHCRWSVGKQVVYNDKILQICSDKLFILDVLREIKVLANVYKTHKYLR